MSVLGLILALGPLIVLILALFWPEKRKWTVIDEVGPNGSFDETECLLRARQRC